MMKLMMDSAFATLLILISIAITFIGVMEYGTFLGFAIAIPLLIWAQAIKFRVNHTVFVRR